MFKLEFDNGFYGAAASIRVYNNEQEVARHWWGETRTDLLHKLVKPYVGKYEPKTQRYELSPDIPSVILNAFVRNQYSKTPMLPMGERIKRVKSSEVVSRFLEDVDVHSVHDGVVLDGRYLITVEEERGWASGYYLSSSIKIKSILRVVDLCTNKKYVKEVKIPDLIDSRRFDEHLGGRIRYVWPPNSKYGFVVKTDRKEIGIRLNDLK